MVRLSSDRVRAIIERANNEKELVSLLRYHKIPFYMESDTDPCFRIPSKKGMLQARMNRSRFEIHNTSPVPFRPDYMEV